MAELNSLEGQTNGGGGGGGATTAKRQRRPSVRLGDIGGDPQLGYDHHRRMGSWKQQQQQKASRGKSNENLMDKNEISDGEDLDMDMDGVAIGSWKSFRDVSKSKRGRGGSIRKRVRSNWVSSKIEGENDKLLTNGEEEGEEGEGNDKNLAFKNFDDDEEDEEEEEEEEEERDESPVRSFDNRKRKMEGALSDTVMERNGVKIWLNQLGLGRYANVFEIHEVDDEVLPMLTLEDLKDMGINAVGTRRKMYCSIQKLNKGFS